MLGQETTAVYHIPAGSPGLRPRGRCLLRNPREIVVIKNSESHSSICLEFNGDSISSCELLSSSHPDGTSLPHVSIDVSVISRLAHHLGTRKCRPFPRHCSLLGMFYITSPTSLLDVANLAVIIANKYRQLWCWSMIPGH